MYSQYDIFKRKSFLIEVSLFLTLKVRNLEFRWVISQFDKRCEYNLKIIFNQ